MDRDSILNLPKVDLHVHLDGSLRPPTALKLAEQLPIERRLSTSCDAANAVVPPKRCTLEEYLRAFKITVAVLQTEEALERAAYELCEDAARENVIYIEVRYAPFLHLQEGLSPQQVVEAVLAGMRRAEKAYPIRTGLILCAMKQESTARSDQLARLAVDYTERGVVAIDLAGPERDFPPSLHHRAIEIAGKEGLHVTIHAGEGCCPEQIKEALDLGAERIGHGVYLYQDTATQLRVAQMGIPLEVCPTSNLQISGVMDSYADHPLKRYLDLGIRVTLNTDNRLMSQTDSTNEFAQVIDAFSLTADEVKTILINSAEAAFAPDDTKVALRQQVEAAFE